MLDMVISEEREKQLLEFLNSNEVVEYIGEQQKISTLIFDWVDEKSVVPNDVLLQEFTI